MEKYISKKEKVSYGFAAVGSYMVAGITQSYLMYFFTDITGFLLERIFRRRWWDYTQHRFQFEGYISFPLLLVWGLLALVSILVLDPLLAGLIDRIPRPVGLIILLVCLGLIAADFVVSLVSVLQLRFRLKRLSRLSEDFRDLSAVFGSAITRRVQRRVLKAHNLEAEKLLEADRKSVV